MDGSASDMVTLALPVDAALVLDAVVEAASKPGVVAVHELRRFRLVGKAKGYNEHGGSITDVGGHRNLEAVNQPAAAPPQLLAALGLDEILGSVFNQETQILMLEIQSTEVLANLQPDFAALHASHDGINGVLVTAAAVNGPYDFHSRYFWPWSGTNEDPVTGGTHTFLAPYWARRLGKSKLNSFQASKRTGSMTVELLSDTLLSITGQAVIVLSGQFSCDVKP